MCVCTPLAPSKPGPGAGPACDRLVVLVARGAEREVVHRALRGGLQPERAVQRVDDALRGFDVAGDDRARRHRVEHRALRHPDVERAQATGIQRDRFRDQRAEHIQHCSHGDRARRVEIVRVLRRGAGEVDDRRTRRPVDRDADGNSLAVVELVVEAAVVQPADRAAHAGLAVVLDVGHVPEQCRPAVHRGGTLEFADAAGVRGELRAQVGEVLLGIARRPPDVGEQVAHLGLCEAAIADDADRRNQHAFLGDVAAAGWHRSRRRAADVGMVRTRCGEEVKVLAGCVEHRRDDGHVGQVRATVVGRVEQEGIAWAQVVTVGFEHRGHAGAHRPEVDGHVRCIRDEAGGGVEQRAREIEPLLDVHRARGLLQHDAHLLGDVHVEPVEDFEMHRVRTVGIGRGRPGDPARPQQPQDAAGGHGRDPTRCDPAGRAPLDHQRRTRDDHPRPEVAALVQRNVMPRAVEPGPRVCGRQQRGGRSGRCLDGLVIPVAFFPGLGRDRRDHDAIRVIRKSVQSRMSLEEGPAQRGCRLPLDFDRRVRAREPQLRRAPHGDRGATDVLAQQFCTRHLLELGQPLLGGERALSIERRLEAAPADTAPLCESDAPGGEHAGQRMQQQVVDAEQFCDCAGVLAGCAAERQQREPAGVLAVAQREFADGIRHLRLGDRQERVGQRLDRVLRTAVARHRPCNGCEA